MAARSMSAGRGALAVACAVAMLAGVASGEARAQADVVYTIGNYPVDATAENALAAKQKALADGQQAAFRSLLKRLVPVTAYNRLDKFKAVKAGDLVDSVSVRSERNSNTRYIANLDFQFSAEGVRRLLRQENVPFIDTQAGRTALVPIVVGGNGAGEAPSSKTAKAWSQLWSGLDLERALTPLMLGEPKAAPQAPVIKALLSGDSAGVASLATEHRSDQVVAAIAEADLAGGRLTVTLAGEDAVGTLRLTRKYRIEKGDLDYALEYAAVVSLGILEGRWKSNAVQSRGGMEAVTGPGEAVEIVVAFQSRGQWEEVRRQLGSVPGVEGIDVMSLSARNAVVSLRFPGGGAQLARALAGRGMQLADSGGGTWALRAGP